MHGSYRISAFRDIDTDCCEAGSSLTLQANGLVRPNRNGADRLVSKNACIDGPESSAATADDIATDSEDRITGVGYQGFGVAMATALPSVPSTLRSVCWFLLCSGGFMS